MDNRVNILLVEDIPIDAELTERELMNANIPCQVTRVATKKKFLRALEEDLPDIILADYTLPQFSGLEALKLVKERNVSVPFILVTGTQREEVAVECMKEGADDYILKTSLKRLPGAIQNALAKRKAEQERVVLQEELQRSAARTLTIFESITDAFFAVTADWHLMYLNPKSDDFLKRMQKSRQDLWGSMWWDEFPMPEASPGRKALLRAMTEGVPAEFEEYFAAFDAWLYVRAYPADDGLSIYAQDITDRKRSETLQRAVYRISEATSMGGSLVELFGRLHEIVGELMPARNFSIALRNANADSPTFAYFSDEHPDTAAVRSTGICLAEYVLRQNRPMIVSAEEYARLHDTGAIANGPAHFIDWLGVPLRSSQGPVGVIAVCSYAEGMRFGENEQNILSYVSEQIAMAIERKRAEEKIRDQVRLLDIAQDAILELDMEHRVVFWNKSAERIYGWTSSEALGQRAEDLFQRQQTHLEAALKEVMASGLWFGELTQVNKGGQPVLVESRWNLVRNDEGQPKSVLVINTDITEKKQLERQFLRAQRMESIGTLASGIAHDLNNVLAPMRMAIPLLRDALTTPSSKTILETLEMTAKRGEGIVKQVLSFVRGMEGERSALKLKHLVNETSRFLRETVNPSIKIMTRCPADLWQVKGDATQLSQVLMNLSVNARDAMPEGGTLRVELQNLTLSPEMSARHLDAKPGPYVLLTVADTGMGIPAENLSRIFDPFFTTKDPGKGTGLGLATVATIVKSHGGFIDLQSEIGRGTQFKVYLPATEVEQAEVEAAAQEIPSGHGETILVVEDEESVSGLIQTILLGKNYNVLSAADGTEALAVYMANREQIQLVLVDMLMPVLDGAATIRALRKINSDLKIVAMSGLLLEKASDENTTLLKSLPFLSKPFDPEALLRIMASVLATEESLVEAA